MYLNGFLFFGNVDLHAETVVACQGICRATGEPGRYVDISGGAGDVCDLDDVRHPEPLLPKCSAKSAEDTKQNAPHNEGGKGDDDVFVSGKIAIPAAAPW